MTQGRYAQHALETMPSNKGRGRRASRPQMAGSKPKTRNVRIFLDGDDTERGISRRDDPDESV